MADSIAIPSASEAHLRRTPLGLGFNAVYGAGAVLDGVVQTALGTFLFFYLTAVCGLSNSLAGLSLFAALAVDAVADPLVGSFSDNSWSRWGRRHPFMLAGAVPVALALGALFSIPSGLAGGWLFAFATLVSIGLRVSYSVFILPYTALGAELSDDYAERTRIVAIRALFYVAGGLGCIGFGLFGFLSGPQGLMHRAAYVPFGWGCAGLALAGALIATFGTLRALPRLHRVATAKGAPAARFVRDLGELVRNRSFVVLFITVLIMFIGNGVAAALTLHAVKFFWRLPPQIIQAITLAAPLGIIVGVPASVFISNRFEKRRVIVVCLILLTSYYAVVPTLAVFGLAPRGQLLWALLLALALVLGAVTGCAAIGFQSMMADAADEHEALFGTRREGLYFAGLNFAAKAASGAGALVAGVSLDAIGFPTNLAARGDASLHMDASVIRNLGLMVGPGVAIIYAVSIAVFLAYRLDRATYVSIQRTLDERRAALA
jgi:GPH family glycoside/pentoside/hexuronide:cation symporter